jgi:hypothetical protein
MALREFFNLSRVLWTCHNVYERIRFSDHLLNAGVSKPGMEPACYSSLRIAGGLTVGVLCTREFESRPQRHILDNSHFSEN